uniref:Nematicidal protein 2 n=1 Tax=Xenorhabdus bovienii TaxID=40576 RepID=Q9EVR7_XENBV|nr:nematicidal protein 2 [Xenorhabdus bovienii]
MSDNNEFFTQANNFTSAVSGGVDPRTGLYNIQITLGHIVGNGNLGPTLPLTLSYSPLNKTDIGFGIGFNFGLSVYDRKNSLLSLSTGENYKVIETDKTVKLQQKKLDNLRFEKDLKENCYRIIHKSGDIEVLTGFNNNAFDLKVPKKLLNPAGHAIYIDWNFEATQPRLNRIYDDLDGHDIPLLNLEYQGLIKTILTLFPGQKEGYRTELRFLNRQLNSIHNFSLGNENPLTWSFGYTPIGKNGILGQWITSMTAPGGLKETVNYSNNNQGHHFPQSANLPVLPYVTLMKQVPGAGQPAIQAEYSYTSHNYVGGGSNGIWNNKLDNLYGLMTEYNYGSTESRRYKDKEGHDQIVRIERTYNNYHLLTSECKQQNGYIQTTETAYYAIIGHNFDSQPSQFQLPKTKTETWRSADNSYRSEITETTFDESGNPLTKVIKDKKTQKIISPSTHWEYYPPAGEVDNCPPEPYGFTRFVKKIIQTPYDSEFKDDPEKFIQYRYSLIGSQSHVTLKIEERHYSATQLLNSTLFQYNTDKSELGRLLKQTECTKGENGKTYSVVHKFTYTKQDDTLQQSHSITTHDNFTIHRSQVRSRYTGRLFSDTDTKDIVTQMSYDKLGRLLTRTLNSGTPYANTLTYDYELNNLQDDNRPPFVITTTDVNGNQLRNEFDGAGRHVSQCLKDSDGDGKFYTIHTQQYDEQGRHHTSTYSDYLTNGRQQTDPDKVHLSMSKSYDNWGQIANTHWSYGVSEKITVDPITLTATKQLQSNSNNVQTGKEVTTYTPSQQPIQITLFDEAGHLQSCHTLTRDGWDRVRKETDAIGQCTIYQYDNYNRVIQITLPDGTIVNRKYAPFSTDTLITDIRVNGISLGQQTFDGLSRLTQSQDGGRVWAYTYSAGNDQCPSTVITPDGQFIHYQYQPELDDAVLQVASNEITQQFSYNPVTGALLKAVAEGQSLTPIYYPSGRLKMENINDMKKMSYLWTLRGLENGYTDLTGTIQKISRDTHGRVTQIKDSSIKTTLNYDDLNRHIGSQVTDLATGHMLTTTVEFDGLNREIGRKLCDSSGHTLDIQQSWLKTQQLANRIVKLNGVLQRTEQYSYDSRNRLNQYKCDGAECPTDKYGHSIVTQNFTYDIYGNITACHTTFADGTEDHATFKFANPTDPCQLTEVHHTHPDMPDNIRLKYDKAGRVINITDNHGNTENFTYDTLGRLQNGQGSVYGYDPLNRLVSQKTDTLDCELYYRETMLVNEVRNGEMIRLLRTGETIIAQQRASKVLLTGTDSQQSVILTSDKQNLSQEAYSAYGKHKSTANDASILGYNGERADPVSGVTHLGNGYRSYDPTLMRFHTPDSLSPFGAGGINPYSYCLGDPINRSDPSGHLSWQAWTGIGMGIAGLLLTIATGGMAIAAAGGIAAAIASTSTTALAFGALSVTSDITSIVSGALEDASPKASSILGWVSMGMGAAGLAESAIKGGTKLATHLGAFAEDGENALLKSTSESSRIKWGVTRSLDREIVRNEEGQVIKDHSRGYTDNFMGKGEQAILVHGDKDGFLYHTEGNKHNGKGPYTRHTPEQLVDYLKDNNIVDLTQGGDKPVHLLSCYGKSSGAADKMAKYINRPVIAYSNKPTISQGLARIERKDFFLKSTYHSYDPRKIILGRTEKTVKPKTFRP